MNACASLISHCEHTPELDAWELLIRAILDEAGELRPKDREDLAARVLALGGYESPDDLEARNERARLAVRLAARLTSA